MDHPFFILGTGRCGSRLLCEILQAHPKIALCDEAKAINFVWFCSQLASLPADSYGEWILQEPIRLRGLVQSRYTAAMAEAFSRNAKAILCDFYRREFPDREFTHWGDKLPNPQAAAAIRAIWPNTRYILCVRDPRDVACSFRAYSSRDSYKKRYPHVQKMSHADHAVIWRNLNSTVLDDLSPLVLRYEDVIQDTAASVAECLEHLGLPMVAEVESAIRDNRSFELHGTARSPAESIGRWKQELAPTETREIEDLCGEAMTRFGYSK